MMGQAKRRAAQIAEIGFAGAVGPGANDEELVAETGACLAVILAAIEPLLSNPTAVLNALCTAHHNLMLNYLGPIEAERKLRQGVKMFPALARQRALDESAGSA